MHSSTLSLTLTRQYVTELVRSPRAIAALGPSHTHLPRRSAMEVPKTAVPGDPAVADPLAGMPALTLQPEQSV